MECKSCGCRHFHPVGPVIKKKGVRSQKMERTQKKSCRHCKRIQIYRELIEEDDGGMSA